MSQVLHVFFDINMNQGFPALTETLYEKTKRNLRQDECAVFINKHWSAAKLLFADGLMVYWQNQSKEPLTYDQLRALPSRLASEMVFSQKAERAIVTGAQQPKRKKRRPRIARTEDEARAS